MQDPMFELEQAVTHLHKMAIEAEMLARYFVSTADRRVSIPDGNLFMMKQRATEAKRATNRLTRVLQHCEIHNRTHNRTHN